MKEKTVVVLYSDARREYFATEEQFKTEEEVYFRSKVISEQLKKIGFNSILLPGNLESILKLKKIRPNVVLNLVDSVEGREDKIASIPAYLDELGIPYTGAGVSGLTINSDKYLTKTILEKSGIPVPEFQLFKNGKEELNNKLKFPLIIKLNQSHGSLEISQESVVENELQLRKRISYLMTKYHQSVIAERYIKGKEITVLMIDDSRKKIILAEERILFKKEKYPLYDFEAAWGEKEIYDAKPFSLNNDLKKQIIKSFEVLQLRDYGRFEIIVDNNNYFFIDPNANPAFGPYGTTSGPFGYLLYLNKISFDKVAEKIIDNAISRFK